MAIKFLSGQTISGTLTVSGNVQGATFNGLAINTTGVNNVANQIVRTEANGYVNFGWINSVSGNHTGSITRITASNDAYLRYVTPAQFRTGVTDGFYAPSSTVTGVTSVATGNGLSGGTITNTGTLTMSGDYTGIFTVHEGQVWDPTTQGTAKGSIHIDPDEGTDHAGGALTFGASDASSGSNSQAGIYIRSDGSYGTKMYLATTDSYATGSKTALNIDHSGNVNITRGFLQVSNGNISLSGTGRIQGVDTVSASTDAANKAYVDAHPGSGGTVTSVATGNGLTGGTITSSGTLTMSGDYTGNFSITGANLAGNSFSDPDIVLSITDEDTTASIRNKMTGSSAITKVSDATAPAPGCFQVNGSYYPQGFGPYYKISEGDEFIFEFWIRYVSGAATYNLLYAGSNFYNAAGTYLGNSQRYWGESAANINANTPGWYHISGTLGPSRGSGTGNIPTTAESMRLLFLFNYNPNGSIVTNYCGLKVYKSNPTVTKLYRKTLGSEASSSGRNRDLVVDSNGDIYTSSVIAPVGMTLDVDNGNVSALTIDNVGSTTFSGYTYFPNYLFHAGDTNTRIEFTTGTVTLRGDTSILLDGPVTANSSMTVASTLTTSGQITANGVIYLKDRITLPASGLSSVSGRPAYNIYQEGGAWTNPFPDLCIAMHTGIKFGAHANYNGMRFYDDYTMATQVMSINNSSDPLGANNVYVTNSLQAGSSLRAPIFYDSDNTAYYLNPASTSNLSKVVFNTSSSGLPRQITIKEDGDTENSMGSYPGAWTSALNIQSNDASTYLWLSPLTSNIPRIQTNYGQLDFYTGSNSGRALHLSGTSARSEIFYDLQNTAYYGDFAGTSNLNGLTVAGTITGTIETANKLAITGYQTNGQSFYQSSGSFAGFSGWHNYYIGNHGNGSNYYNTTIAFPFWGQPRYSRLEGGTSRGPYNFLTNEADQTIGVYLQSTTSLRAPIFYDYNNTAFYLDPSTTGTSVNVAGDVVAYASSDIRFKNNIIPITNALDKLSKIGGYTFEWNEISHKETGKKDIGVVAQEVEEILPEIVQTRSNGYKAVDYQKLTALLIESVKEQQVIINDLKTRIETLENN